MTTTSKLASALGKKRGIAKRKQATVPEVQQQSQLAEVPRVSRKHKKLLDTVSTECSTSSNLTKTKSAHGGASRRGSHRMANAGGCEVKWYYAHFKRLQSKKGNYYLDYGTLVHTALAYFYAQRMERKPAWYTEQPDVRIALEEDAMGHTAWLQKVDEMMKAYERYEAGDPWLPVYNEEEFETHVGDLDPDGVDEPAIDIEYQGVCFGKNNQGVPCLELTKVEDEVTGEVRIRHEPHPCTLRISAPRLNEEIVTCRPDLIVRKNGLLWLIDHKTGGAAKNGSGKLPVINEQYPDYTYYWQAMVNLHVVRANMHIEGFQFNRMKRDTPFDFARDEFPIPARQYAKMPRSIRECVRRERQLLVKSALYTKDLIAFPWECKVGNWACTYAKICHTDTIEERDAFVADNFNFGI